MGKASQIALARMAHYYLAKGRLSRASECLRELYEELDIAEDFSKNSSIEPVDDKRDCSRQLFTSS